MTMNTGLKKIIDNSSYGCGLLGELNHIDRNNNGYYPMLDMTTKKSMYSYSNDFWIRQCWDMSKEDYISFYNGSKIDEKKVYWYRPESYWRWKNRNSTRSKMKGIEANKENVEYEIVIGVMNRVIDNYKLSLERKLKIEEEIRIEEERKVKERLEYLEKNGFAEHSGTTVFMKKNNRSIVNYSYLMDSVNPDDRTTWKDFTRHIEIEKNKRIFDNLMRLIREERELI